MKIEIERPTVVRASASISKLPKANTIKLPGILKTQIVATKPINNRLEELRELKRQKKTLEKLIDSAQTEIEDFMGDALELLDARGNEIATWKYNKDGITLSKELVELNYPDVYTACLVKKDGDRKFVIKI